MSFAKIKGNLTSRIGAQVRFGTPKDIGAKGGRPIFGTIVDEVWATPKINTSFFSPLPLIAESTSPLSTVGSRRPDSDFGLL